jgi:hypothetical protein
MARVLAGREQHRMNPTPGEEGKTRCADWMGFVVAGADLSRMLSIRSARQGMKRCKIPKAREESWF